MVIAELAVYGLERKYLILVYSCLKVGNNVQRKINSTYSDYTEIIFGVQQISILGLGLFNFWINDVFFFFETASLRNFGDNNTLPAWGETVSKLIDTRKSESDSAIDWITKNEMVINPDKFQVISFDKKKSNLQTFTRLLKTKLSS